MGRVRLAELDAVTIDGYGTLLELRDPVGELHALLPDCSRDDVERAFRAEAEYYVAHSHEGRDPESLARLRADCTRVFNRALGSTLTPEQYVGALRFEVVAGVHEALQTLRAHGLALGIVANWDYGLHEHLQRHGLDTYFDVVVIAARKPDPTAFRLALERLGVEPHRALHVGDHRPHDEEGARAAGMRFEPTPLREAIDRWL